MKALKFFQNLVEIHKEEHGTNHLFKWNNDRLELYNKMSNILEKKKTEEAEEHVRLVSIYFKQIDKGRNEKKALVKGKSFKPIKTSIERYSDVFKSLGFPLDFSNSEFPIKPELSTKVYNLIGQDHKKWIGIAPFAAFKGKMYPIDLMEQVIKQLGETYKILLFGGGAKEQKVLSAIQENNYSNGCAVLRGHSNTPAFYNINNFGCKPVN